MTGFAKALAAFRVRQPAQVQAETDAMVARLLAPLDELARDFQTELGRMHADGSLPDRRKAPRKEPAR
ncbi:hypothetical protein H9645_03760 [Luteimonas sp. Sa2BVA3]|uniref:Uncharacterized protein n=1 Tax=Luteimonas colneyensis TaxID=2762230 RepID=A0ABR8UGI7_9GAMM|nr:hypothetical protein [Luteimonas colneyensis]MBD7987138.1 hypothetical protein [Luteimonas colneyensis]